MLVTELLVVITAVLALAAYLGILPGSGRKELTHKKKYDPHYTRKLEQQEFGYILTTCDDDDCKECFPKALVKSPAIVIPKYPSGAGKKAYPDGGKPVRKCSTCKVPLDDDGWCSNGCVKRNWTQDPRYKGYTQKDIDFQNEMRRIRREQLLLEEKIKKQLQKNTAVYVPADNHRYRIVDGYRTKIPDRVPSNATVETEYDANMCRETGYLIWRWTESYGKAMYYKSPAPLKVGAPEFDYIHSDQHATPIKKVRTNYGY